MAQVRQVLFTTLLLSCSNKHFSRGDTKGLATPSSSPQPPIPIEAQPLPSPSPSPAPPLPSQTPAPTPALSFGLSCDQSRNLIPIELSGSASSVIRVHGDFCARATSQLTIVFVIDFSGSMAVNDPPLKGGSCGRYDAARAVMERVKSDMRQGDTVNVGLINFGTNAVITGTIMSLSDFNAGATAVHFCGSSMEATNYKIAFDRTKELLAPVSKGSKVLYFISDGLPTAGAANSKGDGTNDPGGLHAIQGKNAYNELKAAVQGLTGNFLYLSAANQTASAGRSYLESLSGAAERVKVATDASQLAEKIVELAQSKVVLDDKSIRAELSVNDQSEAIEFLSFSEDPNRSGVYLFETKDFSLKKSPEGGPQLNSFLVKINGSDGVTYESRLDFRYTPSPVDNGEQK